MLSHKPLENNVLHFMYEAAYFFIENIFPYLKNIIKNLITKHKPNISKIIRKRAKKQ